MHAPRLGPLRLTARCAALVVAGALGACNTGIIPEQEVPITLPQRDYQIRSYAGVVRAYLDAVSLLKSSPPAASEQSRDAAVRRATDKLASAVQDLPALNDLAETQIAAHMRSAWTARPETRNETPQASVAAKNALHYAASAFRLAAEGPYRSTPEVLVMLAAFQQSIDALDETRSLDDQHAGLLEALDRAGAVLLAIQKSISTPTTPARNDVFSRAP